MVVPTSTMSLNKKAVQQIYQTQITFERCCLVKSYCNALCKTKLCLLAQVDFDTGRIVTYRDCDL